MALHKTPAVILKSRRWGEADRIVTCYTLTLGRVSGVARGARRMKSRFGSALEPFVHTELNLFEKHGDSLYRVTQADILESFPRLREDLGLMSAAARLVNLVVVMTVDHDRDRLVFETLVAGMRALQEGSDPSLTALVYQVRLMEQTGFRPQIDHCAVCGAVPREGDVVLFAPRSGGLLCRSCASRCGSTCLPLSPGGWAFLRQVSRMAPSTLVRLKATGQVRGELAAVVEQFVHVVTGTRLPSTRFLVADGPGRRQLTR